ncbi:c-type cytochrome [Acidithiobacillus montserratensis]|uniref:C-type cytochrome n=1 Tax=Acidithiobacillus montserratensis TaxID=2729135 RepID=A0ACD5HCD8_9PROT|nr:c-type cytochrome [Acidithiobacillus montserratensis]
MMNLRNISPIIRLLVLAGVVTLAAACAKKEETSTAPSDSSATSSATSSDQTSGSTQSDASSASTTSPSSFDVQSGSGHFEKVAAVAGMNTDQMAKAKSLAEAKGCFACHQVEAKVVGPAFAWVAYKYKGNPKAVDTLSHAIEHGVSGVWGGMPMPAQSVTPAQAKELAAWVLAQKPLAPPKSA